MVERIRKLCEQNNTNFSALEKELNFANGSIAKTTPNTSVDRIHKLAERLGVTMEYIYSGEPAQTLSASEKELLSGFRQLNDDGRATLANLLQSLLCNPSNLKKLSNSEIA